MDSELLIAQLLRWYDSQGRILPWRENREVARSAKSRSAYLESPGPYRVWLSEIMLQQTTVATVIPYYNLFIKKWPNVHTLARASLDEVLACWAGLGYYARARNMHRCAKIISKKLNGKFPETEMDLMALPGIGSYTAAAITAIAFNQPAIAIDANVERVLSRLHAITEPLPKAKKMISTHAQSFIPNPRPGDFTQALMDLGATVCKPRQPSCYNCPWVKSCKAEAIGEADTFPRKLPKPARPERYGVAFWAVRRDGFILLRRRPEKGLLGGMMEVPGTEWRLEEWSEHELMETFPFIANWSRLPGSISHSFTHFKLQIIVYIAHIDGRIARNGGRWYKYSDFQNLALPTLTNKIIRHVREYTSY
tara:strand:+ start:13959 stop:15053 length:1095 start_codon:yes stop_codon:yes gene_type:complete